ncbi:hypothetical protein D043_4884, partial [Vibrio parahaemolyticus EKP-021]
MIICRAIEDEPPYT